MPPEVGACPDCGFKGFTVVVRGVQEGAVVQTMSGDTVFEGESINVFDSEDDLTCRDCSATVKIEDGEVVRVEATR